VNTAIYLHGTSGTATATRALVDALGHLDDVEVQEVSPRTRGGRRSLLNALADARWDLWQASRQVRDVDLLVSSCNIGLRGPARKHLLVVYDTMVFDRPELFDRRFAAYFRLLVPPSIRSADRVLTMSEHARDRILQIAPGADVRVLRWSHSGGEVAQATWPGRPSVLMVGATEPVKNQVAGIEAVALLRRSTGADVALRVIGPAGRAERQVADRLAAVDPDRSWASREVDVPGADLERAYASAWLLLQPSLDEGFGLPLVEAARHGLPVVHSGRGALPSVLRDVDARCTSAEGLAAAMTPLLDRDRWHELASATRQQARHFEPDTFRAAVAGHVADLLPDTP
jgi:glycosyltransferase involved in cell wall biosynthesis